ncbi:MAG: hypothetical protein AAFO58_06200, partial [Pseudomonadota bacterium]
MFRDWGFLLGEIWVLLILAALLGLLAGWLIWGRREASVDSGSTALRAELEACRAKHADKDARIAALEADLATAQMGAEPVAEMPAAAVAPMAPPAAPV